MPERAPRSNARSPGALGIVTGARYGPGMRIPMDRLSADALLGVIDDFILREGTDYGHDDISIEAKRARVMQQLRKGEAHVVFDEATETCSIVTDETR